MKIQNCERLSKKICYDKWSKHKTNISKQNKYRRWFYLLWILEIFCKKFYCTPWQYNKGTFLFDQQMKNCLFFLFPDLNRITYWTKFYQNIVAFFCIVTSLKYRLQRFHATKIKHMIPFKKSLPKKSTNEKAHLKHLSSRWMLRTSTLQANKIHRTLLLTTTTGFSPISLSLLMHPL